MVCLFFLLSAFLQNAYSRIESERSKLSSKVESLSSDKISLEKRVEELNRGDAKKSQGQQVRKKDTNALATKKQINLKIAAVFIKTFYLCATY